MYEFILHSHDLSVPWPFLPLLKTTLQITFYIQQTENISFFKPWFFEYVHFWVDLFWITGFDSFDLAQQMHGFVFGPGEQ